MDVISIAANSLNWAFWSVGNIIHSLLQVNYYILSELTYAVQGLIGYFINIFQVTQHGAEYAVFDFISFIFEFVHGVTECISFLYAIVFLLVMWACNFMYVFISILYKCYSVVASIFHAILYAATLLINVCFHFVKLLFSATLLLLTFLPNAFVVIGIGIITYGNLVANYIKECADSIVKSTRVTFLTFIDTCTNSVQSIPLDAYLGLAMIIFVFYMHKTIIKAMEKLGCILHHNLTVALNTFMRATRQMISHLHNFFCLLWTFFCQRQRVQQQEEIGQEEEDELSEESESDEVEYYNVNNNTRNRYFLRQRTNTQGNYSGTFKLEDESSEDEYDLSGLKKQLEMERDRYLCIVCQDKTRNAISLPCRHLCMCNICCETILKTTRECPVCRSYIYENLQVYI